ncbi:MAG: hypothetical protein C0609_01080 [Deltaproteobacteria bacterium]|nr:MAG: hypothetical protein C0609_01080 [Deltaproteobacteria bacterium]
MQWKRHSRLLFAFVIGVFAGISLNTAIYPAVISSRLGGDSMGVLAYTDPFTPYISILWGICAAALGWYGGSKMGMSILGICGFVTGLFLGLAVLHLKPIDVALGTIIAITYGIVGGYILGKIWPANS